ncbi:MAG: Asp-tRNA(Asn)/Glu-tRNA(Gln) amidotransferase subunit GatC [Terriglobia bacterium]
MELSEPEVLRVADLAHLELTPEEVQKFQPQLAAILEYVQTLNQLDTANVEPMAQVIVPGAPESALRPDDARASLPQEIALQNAPEAGAGHFKVPSVIDKRSDE